MKIHLIGLLTFCLFIHFGCKTAKSNKTDLKASQPEKVKYYTIPDSLPKECINLPNFQYSKDSLEIFYQVSFKTKSEQEALEKFKLLMSNPIKGKQLFLISEKDKLDTIPNQFTIPIYYSVPPIRRSSNSWVPRLSYEINLKLEGDTARVVLNKIKEILPPYYYVGPEWVSDGSSFSSVSYPLVLTRATLFNPNKHIYYISNECFRIIQIDITMKKLIEDIKKFYSSN